MAWLVCSRRVGKRRRNTLQKTKKTAELHEEFENGKRDGAFTYLTSVNRDICSYWLKETHN